MPAEEGLWLMCQNIRSLASGFPKLQQALKTLNTKPHIIMAQETFEKKGSFILKGYQAPIYKTRKNKRGGGVIMWIRSDIVAGEYITPFIQENFESIGVSIKLTDSDKELKIVNLYRPPQGNMDVFFGEITKLLSEGNTIVCGDINIDLLKDNGKSKKVVRLLEDNGCGQLVNLPTRQKSRPTLIDHIYGPISISMITSVEDFSISDHSCIMAQIKCSPPALCPTPRILGNFNYKKENVEKVKNDLGKFNWYRLLEPLDVDKASLKLENILKSSILQHCYRKPKVVDVLDLLPRPIFNLKCRVKKKLNIWRKDVNDGSKEESYKKLKHRLDKEIAELIKEEERRLLSERDTKKLWKNIKLITKTNKPEQNVIKLDGAKDDESDRFADYFGSIASNIRNNLPSVKTDPLQANRKASRTFKFHKVTRTYIWDILKNSTPKNSQGHDRISSKIIKLLAYELLTPLTLLANKIICTGTFPETWKKSLIIPLYKKGDPLKECNYRPISLLPCLSKIVEKVLVKQISRHFELHNLFPKTQYGFRAKKSTEQAVNNLVFEIEKLKNSKKDIAVVLLDFSKAFDLIDHGILFKKLKKFGFDELSLNLLKSYLQNRKFRVTCNGKMSKEHKLNIGTPQGSVMGPLLYLIYTAEILNLLPKDLKIIFADDTALIISFNKKEEHKLQKIAKKLEILQDHFTANKLKLNMGKTEIITSFAEGEIKVGNEKLKVHGKKHTVKYLGVNINIALDWDPHAEQVIQKCKFGLVQLHRLKQGKPEIRNLLFNAMIKSHIGYGLSAWGPTASKTSLKRLNMIIKSGVRCVAGVPRKTHSAPLMKKYKQLYIDDFIRIKICSEYLTLKSPGNQNNGLTGYFCEVKNSRTNNIRSKTPTATSLKQTSTINAVYDQLALETRPKTKLRKLKDLFTKAYPTSCTSSHCTLCQFQSSNRV